MCLIVTISNLLTVSIIEWIPDCNVMHPSWLPCRLSLWWLTVEELEWRLLLPLLLGRLLDLWLMAEDSVDSDVSILLFISQRCSRESLDFLCCSLFTVFGSALFCAEEGLSPLRLLVENLCDLFLAEDEEDEGRLSWDFSLDFPLQLLFADCFWWSRQPDLSHSLLVRSSN